MGEVDITQFDAKDLQIVQANASIQVTRFVQPGYTYIGWNQMRGGKDPTYGDQNARDVDAFVLGWTQTADPDKFQTWHSSRTHPSESNFILFKNSDLDKAIEDSRGHCAPAERKAAIKAANQILNEEQPYNFGIAQNYLVGVNKRVHGDQTGTFARWGQARPELWSVQ